MLREGTRKHVGKTGSRGPVRLRANGLAAGRNAILAAAGSRVRAGR